MVIQYVTATQTVSGAKVDVFLFLFFCEDGQAGPGLDVM